MMEVVLKIEKLEVGYKNKAILSPITVNTHTNDMICIVGRNGQGKSTIIKTLCKLLKPISGNIFIKNIHLDKITDKQFSKLVSVVLTQKININHTLVEDFIAFGRYPFTNWLGTINENDRIIISEAMNLCGISHLKGKNFNDLSDGEKQKVNIARAIAQETPVILLDEPTAHLDLANNFETFKLLKKISKECGKSVIFSTHHIESALQLADQIWIVNNSNFYSNTPSNCIQSGEIDKLFTNTSVKYNREKNLFEFD
ncbi:MAG: ABC transporter ATP-binding protein [Flavobacteriales bacterium]|nr:ABC transporter ATP-binding protein [Flavobacteriales bacterium]